MGSGVTKRGKRFVFWIALAFVGQAVALQMIDAGTQVRYQHYKTFDEIFSMPVAPFFIFFVVQSVLVVGGVRKAWPSVKRFLSRFKRLQLVGVGLVFFFSSATVSREISHFFLELIFATFVQTINLGNIFLAIRALPNTTLMGCQEMFKKWLGLSQKFKNSDHWESNRFVYLAALWVIGTTAFLNWFSYERHPHIPDEVAYLYQARYLASGMLAMPAPLVPDAFSLDLMHYEWNRWYSPFPPGWPLVLALGVIAGFPWLVNPLLAGINVMFINALFIRLYNLRVARLSILLVCVSPWYIFMGMNFMAHMFSLFCALGASLAVVKARENGMVIWGWMGGIALGFLSLVRPLEAVVMAGLLGCWALGFGGKRLKGATLGVLAFGTIAVGSLGLEYNKFLTGDRFKFPVMAYFDKYYGPKTNAMGFGPERGVGWPIDPFPGHGLLDAIVNTNLNIFSLNIELFGWSVGSLLFIAIALCSMKLQKSDCLMVVMITTFIAIHAFYWFSGGPDFGARYWFLIIIPCIALTVRGIIYLESQAQKGNPSVSGGGTKVIAMVLTLVILSLVNFFPWRATDKYYHYRGMRPDIRSLAHDYKFGKSLVLIRGNRNLDYASAATYNPVNLLADLPVYAWDRNPQVREQVLKIYRNRPVWIVNGPSLTGAGFKVITGPVAASELMMGKK